MHPDACSNKHFPGRRLRRLIGPALLAAVALVSAGQAADWPEWRGPQSNGVTVESGWLSQWPSSGPRRVWTAQVGEGYSAVTTSAGRLYTMGSFGGQDTVLCLDALSGKPVWKWSYNHPARNQYGGDPGQNSSTSTPVVEGRSVYTLSREGYAVCLNALTGKPVWQKDLARETGSQSPRWGFAGSPLVRGNLVIYNVGVAGTAVDKKTGRVVWKSGGGPAGYATPVPYAIGGQRGVLVFAGQALVGVDAGTGKAFWSLPWTAGYDCNAADPVVVGASVFISSNYDKGCALVTLASGRPGVVWQNKNMRNHFNGSVIVGGAVFGNDQNTLKCLDLRSGAERWQQRGMGKGGLIAAGDKLLVMSERGELFVMQATPDRATQLSRAKVLDGLCWTHPVLSNGYVYCRSREGTLVCLDLKK